MEHSNQQNLVSSIPFTKTVFNKEKNMHGNGLSGMKNLYSRGVHINNWWDDIDDNKKKTPLATETTYRTDFPAHVAHTTRTMGPRERRLQEQMKQQSLAEVKDQRAETERLREASSSRGPSNPLYQRRHPLDVEPPIPFDAPRTFHKERAISVWSEKRMDRGRNDDFSTPMGVGNKNHPCLYGV
eukprot:gnl/Spiro4/27672_TR13790_c0_g1_i1.p1 gnl/Spiro4/27672_TR13790_c0_g1~~gnl/Spiro4/27672_TR13790_c0_g1_i1.p1  ORF type:complete len:184 (+),score=49.53 gnl/Spiro4/27672_TR13790_c0_g1_i1:48-599(+)